MARDTLALVEDLDRRAGDAGLDDLADQLRWHRVIMAGDLDVIVGRDTAALPLGVSIGLVRQLLQRRTVDRLQQLPPAPGELLHHLGVDRGNAFADFHVQFVEREEAPVPELGQHKALDNQNGDLDLGFGECRRLQVVWIRPAARFASRTPFIRTLVASLS